MSRDASDDGEEWQHTDDDYVEKFGIYDDDFDFVNGEPDMGSDDDGTYDDDVVEPDPDILHDDHFETDHE